MRNKTYATLQNLAQPCCVVLGAGSLGSLSAIRSLGIKRIPAIVIDNNKCSIGIRSKYCSSAEVVDDAQTLLLLEEIGDASLHKNVLFCTYDIYLLLVDRHRETLKKYFHLFLPEKYSLQKIMDKKNMLKLAKEAGLDTPLTFFSGEHSLKEITGKVGYPVIVKPSYTQGCDAKVEVVNNEQDLCQTVRKDRFSKGYLVQEIIEGPDDNIWMCLGYCDRNAVPVALFSAHKYRQIPRSFGSTATGVSQQNEEVVEQAITFVKHIGYHGCFDFEVKQCRDEKVYKFIEINYRVCDFNNMAIDSGIDLPCIAYCDALKLPYERNIKQKDGVVWISIIDDFITCCKYYIQDNKFILLDWLGKVLRSDSYAVFRVFDIKPFIFKIVSHVIHIVRRITLKNSRFSLARRAKEEESKRKFGVYVPKGS